VVDSVLFRSLPFTDPDRLVYIWTTHQTDNNSSTSYPDLRDWQERNEVFEDISGFTTKNVNLTGGDEPEFVRVAEAGTNLFDVLRVEAELGRSFFSEDAQWGRKVLVLSNALWKRRFGATLDF
jgi:macrolide transport system ATP-binding/permease protein